MLGEELAVDVGDLAAEGVVEAVRQRQLEPAPAREAAPPPPRPARRRAGRRARSRRRRPRRRRARPASARSPGASACSIRSQPSTSRAIGPAWSKLGASGKQPSIGTSPQVGLKPVTPQQAAGIRIEPPESVPSAASARPAASAAAEPPLEPPAIAARVARVRHRAEVLVLGGRAVGELVQVGLADVRVAGRLEQPHRLGRLARHVLGEQDRAVGGDEPGRVEQVLDRERDPLARLLRAGEEDALGRAQKTAR